MLQVEEKTLFEANLTFAERSTMDLVRRIIGKIVQRGPRGPTLPKIFYNPLT